MVNTGGNPNLSQGILSLLAALMCGWLAIVACICFFILLNIDVFILCCFGILLLPVVGFFGARYGWRNTKSGRPEGVLEPPPSRPRILAALLVFACWFSPKVPGWLGETLSGKPNQTQLIKPLRKDPGAYQRIAKVLSQHPQLECVDRMSTGRAEPFPTLDHSTAHRDEIRRFMKDHPEVERIDRAFDSGVLQFQLWQGTRGFDARERGIAYSNRPPAGLVNSLDTPAVRTSHVNPSYERAGGSWYLYEVVYGD